MCRLIRVTDLRFRSSPRVAIWEHIAHLDLQYRGITMASDPKNLQARATAFSVSVSARAQTETRRQGLSFEEPPRPSANPQRSSDPYNTSGSFDRKKNWARVGKR
jgi:hypothetical protein